MLVEPPDVSEELEYMVGKQRAAGREMNPDRAYYAHWLAVGHRRVGRERDAARIYLRAAVRHRDAGHLVRGLGDAGRRTGHARRAARHRPRAPPASASAAAATASALARGASARESGR